jgi:hypothetical protein
VLAPAPVAQPAKISAAAPIANNAPRRVFDVSIDMIIPSKFYDKRLTSQISIGLSIAISLKNKRRNVAYLIT